MKTFTSSELLSAHWDGKLPVDPVQIAEKAGVGVRAVTPDRLNGASGMIRLEDGKPVIYYDKTEPVVRQRFTVAHELGHFARGHLQQSQTMFRDTRANFYARQSDVRETEANGFAANLLMPARIVTYVIAEKGIKDVLSLARLFQVSEVAMGYRLKNLGLV